MFLWYPVMDLARAPRRAARKKGSGYENAHASENIEGLVDFPTGNNKAKTALKLPWLRNAQFLRSQTELIAT
jgi:hypothetical protein